MTRDCIDPWTYAELGTNGDVKPCCARGSIGNLIDGNLHQILNGGPIRQLRTDLLYGTLDPECARCRLKAPITPAVLQTKVRALFVEPPSQTDPGIPGSDRVEVLLKAAVEHLKSGRQEEV